MSREEGSCEEEKEKERREEVEEVRKTEDLKLPISVHYLIARVSITQGAIKKLLE